jgi:hypothetical protein
MDLDLAQSYYDVLKKEKGDFFETPSLKRISGNKISKLNKKHIIFQNGYSSSNEHATFVELPVFLNQKTSLVIQNKITTRRSQDKIFMGSIDRLLIFKNKKTGVIDQRHITYIPDIDYLIDRKQDISHNQINKLDPQYSGYIEYKTWEGERLYILRIDKAKVTSIINFKKNSSESKNFTTSYESCTLQMIPVFGTSCISVDPESIFGTEECETYLVGHESVYVCVDIPDYNDPCLGNPYCDNENPTPHPGGGGGSGGSTPAPFVPEVNNNFNDSDAICIFNKLKNNSGFTLLLNKFIQSENLNVTFKLADIQGSNGRTRHILGTSNFEILISNEYFISHGGIPIAKTFLHEAFHANLYVQAKLWYGGNLPSNFDTFNINQQLSWITNNPHGSLQDAQHEYIADNITSISNALQAYVETNFPNIANSEFLDDLAYISESYIGLAGTKAYNDFVNANFNGATFADKELQMHQSVGPLRAEQRKCP